MEISKCIDWLTVSQTVEHIGEFEQIVPDGFEKEKQLAPVKYFPKRWSMYPCGIYSLSSDGQVCQKFDLGGEDMQKMRDLGFEDIKTLSTLRTPGANITRLDYAVDIFDTTVTAMDFFYLWEIGVFKPTFRKVRDYHDRFEDRTDSTIYFGSKLSEKYVRVYDKGGQMNMLNRAWLRVEAQNRKLPADNLAADMLLRGFTAAGDAHLRKHFDTEKIPVLRDAVDNADIPLTQIPRKETSWRRWMNEQVIQSAQKHAADADDFAFLQDWIERLKMAIDLQ